MTLQSSGRISLDNLQTEFGGSNPIGISEYYSNGTTIPRGDIPGSGQVALSNYYGKSVVSGTSRLTDFWNVKSSLFRSGQLASVSGTLGARTYLGGANQSVSSLAFSTCTLNTYPDDSRASNFQSEFAQRGSSTSFYNMNLRYAGTGGGISTPSYWTLIPLYTGTAFERGSWRSPGWAPDTSGVGTGQGTYGTHWYVRNAGTNISEQNLLRTNINFPNGMTNNAGQSGVLNAIHMGTVIQVNFPSADPPDTLWHRLFYSLNGSSGGDRYNALATTIAMPGRWEVANFVTGIPSGTSNTYSYTLPAGCFAVHMSHLSGTTNTVTTYNLSMTDPKYLIYYNRDGTYRSVHAYHFNTTGADNTVSFNSQNAGGSKSGIVIFRNIG